MKRFFFSLLLLVVTTVSSFAQCAMCRVSVESTYNDGRYLSGSGLNTGILYLLAMPYLIVGLIAYLWYRQSRKEHSRKMAIWQRLRGVAHS
ncbi:MAG: hypothetical protein J7576_08020 [Siphonobacter aquaeclarae]|nr:hypothetical protein [Siphonobacter aquaeclarae]